MAQLPTALKQCQASQARIFHPDLSLLAGDENVVHLSEDDDDGLDANIQPRYPVSAGGVQYEKAKVCIENFWEIVGSGKAFKNNESDSQHSPFPEHVIVQRALRKIGDISYNALFANSEHFVNNCRYGIAQSDQANTALGIGAVGAGIGLGIYALTQLFKNKDDDKEKKQDF
ncbi:phospholipase A and acyltransferase 3 isoform X2 [Aplysia californica]|uniref:Phospholipase A and acyltransferase 3 isoform X2 n=1 Tax=Aplysia californica TaxID=6500 RepID=A0ABM1A289_APLCA|nr:phospholipase A and acyltransferase 3 isoform X2 [Aplysia californica]